MAVPFHDQFVALFQAQFSRLYRYLDRLTGDSELASDLAQETFVRLYERGSLPNDAAAWLITVALNLFRNTVTAGRRRARLLTVARGEASHSDAAPTPEGAVLSGETSQRVRNAIDGMADREKQLLLLRAEGYSYREIATALDLNEASVGVLLARAKRAFRNLFEGETDASR
jgi:RNA polymerase sigma-70 factor, ECF subfamily